jgi:large subunit ribosomal protein L4e
MNEKDQTTKMKLKIFDTNGVQAGEEDLPSQFSEPVRADLIKKAVLAIQNNKRQAYAPHEKAGMIHAIRISKRRRDYKGSYGKGISRVPKKTMSHRGSQFFWVGANAPGMVGGRRAHPPKLETTWSWKLNIKERRKAICSALSAAIIKDLVEKRGHLTPDTYPFILGEDFEKINKTKQLLESLKKLGFEKELKRAYEPRTRAGKGKLRGRRKIIKKSLLLVVSAPAEIIKAASNLPGVDVINVKKLNAETLAPGGHPGRPVLFTTKAIGEMKKGLFLNNAVAPVPRENKRLKK